MPTTIGMPARFGWPSRIQSSQVQSESPQSKDRQRRQAARALQEGRPARLRPGGWETTHLEGIQIFYSFRFKQTATHKHKQITPINNT